MGSKALQTAAPAKSVATPVSLRHADVDLSSFDGPHAGGESDHAGGGLCQDFSMVRVQTPGVARLQRKLAVGAVDDPAELEADRLADLVTSDADRRGRSEGLVRPLLSAAAAEVAVPGLVEQVLSTQGEPLDRQARSFFEGRFGADFSGVRVHADPLASASARAVDAEAYAVGSHLVFGTGRYAPATDPGRRLLAHELTHVLQQVPQAQGRAGLPGLGHGATLRRNPPPTPNIPPPGTGWDGLQGTQHIGRTLSPQQTEIVRDFRAWLETTRNDRSMWARRAGEIASRFSGGAAERAGLYGELQRQMIQVHRSWGAVVEIGADGSRIFYGSIGRAFVVDPNGGCFVGSVKEATHFSVVGGQRLPNYGPGGLTRISPPSGAVPGGAPPAAPAAPAAPGGAPPQTPGGTRAAPEAPRVGPQGPGVVPETPRVAPETPRIAPEVPRVPAGPGAAAGEAGLARGGIRIGPVGGFIIVLGVQLILGWLLGRITEASERRRIEELLRTGVEPDAQRRLAARNQEVADLAEDDPFAPVYANITLTLGYYGSKYRGSPISEALESASVAGLAVSRQDLSSQNVIDEVDYFSFGTTVPFRRRVRMVYSVQLPFEEPLDQRVRRSAAAAAARGTPARQAIGSRQWTDAQRQQFVGAYVAATAGQPQRQAQHDEAARLQGELAREAELFARFGRSSVISATFAARQGLSARAAAAQTHWGSDADRLRFVDAYVAVTAGRPEWSQLHQDAVAYAAELRGPSQGQGTLQDRERQQILDWLRGQEAPR